MQVGCVCNVYTLYKSKDRTNAFLYLQVHVCISSLVGCDVFLWKNLLPLSVYMFFVYSPLGYKSVQVMQLLFSCFVFTNIFFPSAYI